MLSLDASMGEGGGQVLRTSLALSMLTGTPVRLWNIRARRDRPGLQRQHLTAVRAAAEVCQAEVRGVEIGSRELRFTPGEVRPGSYHFAIGTAGSTTLVLQTVLPPLLVAGGPTTLTIEGGTHNIFAPPVDFLAEAFLPLIERMGPRVRLTLERHGFYPRGGGRIVVEISPVARLGRLDLPNRGEVRRCTPRAMVAGLSADIARRELAVVAERLGWSEEHLQVVELDHREGPGNVLILRVESEHVTEVFAGFGRRGVRAEAVAAGAVDEVERYLAAGAPVGEHLADQLLLPLAMAGGGSFTTLPLSLHATTNMAVIEEFLPVRFSHEPIGDEQCRVSVG